MQSLEDNLIDCCVGFDALLGAGSRQEMTYKIQVRGAYLLGATETERVEIYELLQTAYRVRGAVIHGGGRAERELNRALSGRESGTTFIAALARLLARTIRAIVSLQGTDLPDGRAFSFSDLAGTLDRNVLAGGQMLRQRFSSWVSMP
jgi:hypothetical protein